VRDDACGEAEGVAYLMEVIAELNNDSHFTSATCNEPSIERQRIEGAYIILNASIVASQALGANSVYSATKAAVRSFARTWTVDLKDRHIRVNAVSPGFIETPGLKGLMASRPGGEEQAKTISGSVPFGRVGTPMTSLRPWCFLHPTTAATSLESN